ncbi:uncharacterized protein BXZ73DRAFT_50103, partial [Epithele typhae]|uniref:uncharacterized protein n=1 Tax=Epithele typhae TaxID=378194 RepID=UPI0020080D5B
QLRTIAVKIKASPTVLMPAWNRLLAQLALKARVIPIDVCTQWNSTLTLVHAAVELRMPITVFCASDEGSDALGAFALTPREWLIAEQLIDALKDATEFFSRDTPNLALVIPVMDKIDQALTTKHLPGSLFRGGIPYDPAIHAAFGFAKQMLNKYYELTDSVEAYRIAMGEFFASLLHIVLRLNPHLQFSTLHISSSTSRR